MSNTESNLLFMVTCENKEVCNKVLKVMEEEKKQKTIISDFKIYFKEYDSEIKIIFSINYLGDNLNNLASKILSIGGIKRSELLKNNFID